MSGELCVSPVLIRGRAIVIRLGAAQVIVPRDSIMRIEVVGTLDERTVIIVVGSREFTVRLTAPEVDHLTDWMAGA